MLCRVTQVIPMSNIVITRCCLSLQKNLLFVCLLAQCHQSSSVHLQISNYNTLSEYFSVFFFLRIKFEDISKVSYHQNRFSVHYYTSLASAGQDDVMSCLKFRLTTRKVAQALFRAFTENHTFFRVSPLPPLCQAHER